MPHYELPAFLESLTPEVDSVTRLPLRVQCLTDGAEMVLVPPGDFLMGMGPEHEKFVLQMLGLKDLLAKECGPPRQCFLDAYYIDVYPVTNSRYQRFIEATGYQVPLNPSGTPLPSLMRGVAVWDPQSRSFPQGLEDYPVVFIDWFDACAYCAWAGKQLPTESEWEKAARGSDGRLWPWGNDWNADRCNCTGRDLTPVNQYPQGVSPYGCFDMAGNVVQWCADVIGEHRATRGGSLFGMMQHQLCLRRGWIRPDVRCLNLGFRCVYRIGNNCPKSLKG